MIRIVAALGMMGIFLAAPALAQETATPTTAELLAHNREAMQNNNDRLTGQMNQIQGNLQQRQTERQQNFGPVPFGTPNYGPALHPGLQPYSPGTTPPRPH